MDLGRNDAAPAGLPAAATEEPPRPSSSPSNLSRSRRPIAPGPTIPDDFCWKADRYAALAGVVAGVAMLPFLVPYWTVSYEQGLTRRLEEVTPYSVHNQQLLSTASRLHFDAWSHTFYGYGGDSLFPGVLGLSLAAIAVGSGVTLMSERAWLWCSVSPPSRSRSVPRFRGTRCSTRSFRW